MASQTLSIDLNRVEGDLEFELDIENGKVVDARCKGIMYRGFEQLLIGRAAKDGIVITPRVCGICGTAHMYCAVQALEHMWDIDVPANAVRIRNLCLMAENIQSDLRQSFLMFTPDFCNQKYISHLQYPQIKAAFEPFKGKVHRSILEQSKKAVEIVAIWGGQWPHSSYMIPGGVTIGPNQRRIITSEEIIELLAKYIESTLIGVTLEDWRTIKTSKDFDDWLAAHPDTAIGLFTNFSRSIGLDKVGAGSSNMLCYGGYPLASADITDVRNREASAFMIPSGYYDADKQQVQAFDQSAIEEHVKYSWFRDYDGGKHPFEGETVPNFIPDSAKYTWAKAPRYNDNVVQTGPLAEYVVAQDNLVSAMFKEGGDSTWLRQFARMHRIMDTIIHMRQLIKELKQNINEPFLVQVPQEQQVDGQGFGLVQAARGSLGHWVHVKQGKISRYQIVTPTAWNASPRDSSGQHGHWEQSVIGLDIPDVDNPIEIGHIVRSHDPCLVCTVHMACEDKPQTLRYQV